MASQLRKSFKPKSPADNLEPDTREFIPTQVSPDISNFSSARLAPNDSGSCVKQELQTLWEMFSSWLKPEKQSKEQMISQLVLEQFLKTGRYKDKFAVKEKWESSGRNLGTFMESLTDECLKPPVMVHISMQGQEALFSENMTLKEVIKHLKEQQSFRTTTQEKARTPLQIPQDVVLAAGYEDSEDDPNTFLKGSEVDSCVSSPGNEMDSLLIIQTGQYPEPEQGDASYGVLCDSKRAKQGTSRYQAESLSASSYEHMFMEVQPEDLSSTGQFGDAKDGHNPKASKYSCSLSMHQKRHRNERPFVCSVCQEGFYQVSELQIHEAVHKPEKLFSCSTCGRSFTQKTNLQAHERIHTGEKPYTCSLCNSRFRQSSTYYRHLRNYHKSY